MHIYLHSEMYAKDRRKHDIYENNVFLLGINKIFYGKSFFKKSKNKNYFILPCISQIHF